MTKILFLVPYPLKESPSQRFRFEQYFDILKNLGHKVQVQAFFSSREWSLFYRQGSNAQKLFVLLKGYAKRFGILIQLPAFDFIFVHREVTPAGPPIVEWLIAKVFRKKIIYDFDDAIWLTDKTNESWLTKILRWRSKTASICSWGYKVSCGNAYLAAFARQFNPHVIINPTTIDTDHLHNKNLYPLIKIKNNQEIIIGWTGSHSTLKYLKLIESVLQKIEQRFPALKILIIADQKPNLSLNNLEFCYWNVESEIADLLKIDIGIMPLPDDIWAKGKCGFKALQYMALQIPCVISPVGVNAEIVEHGVNGFLASTPEEWFHYLTVLITKPEVRHAIGNKGRETVLQRYSVTSNESAFLALFA
jgi:glycosyltransferase involved in cell wall biosynthesis